MSEPRACNALLYRETMTDPAEYCDDDAEPGSAYCRRHRACDEGDE